MSDARRRVTLLLGVVALLVLLLAAAPAAHGQERHGRGACRRAAPPRREHGVRAPGAPGERGVGRATAAGTTHLPRERRSRPLAIEFRADDRGATGRHDRCDARRGPRGARRGSTPRRRAHGVRASGAPERTGSGKSGDCRARRFFPANATVGRWLSSSSLTVEVPSDSMLAATPQPVRHLLPRRQRRSRDGRNLPGANRDRHRHRLLHRQMASGSRTITWWTRHRPPHSSTAAHG